MNNKTHGKRNKMLTGCLLATQWSTTNGQIQQFDNQEINNGCKNSEHFTQKVSVQNSTPPHTQKKVYVRNTSSRRTLYTGKFNIIIGVGRTSEI
jgi:hypothetical protein